jgi:hypothetical protein
VLGNKRILYSVNSGGIPDDVKTSLISQNNQVCLTPLLVFLSFSSRDAKSIPFQSTCRT